MSDTSPSATNALHATDLRIRRRRRSPRHAAAGRSARHRPRYVGRPAGGIFRGYTGRLGSHFGACRARGAFHDSVEVFPEQHGEPITRLAVDRPRGAFTVIVPVPQDADHVRVVQVTPPQADATPSAARATDLGGPQERELARFPLQISR